MEWHRNSFLVIASALFLLYIAAALFGWTTQDTYYLPIFLAGYVATFLSIPIVSSFLKLLNTNFSSALFGAFFGSLSTYIFANRAKAFDDIAREIKFTNDAIESCGNITNSARGYMVQLIMPLKLDYDSNLTKFNSFQKMKAENPGAIEDQFHIVCDYKKLPSFFIPTAALLVACENISPNGNEIMMARSLAQSVEQLSELIAERNLLVDEMRGFSHIENIQKIAMYLGVGLAGFDDQRNRNIIEGLYNVNQDCIWFGVKVCHALTAHGMKLRAGKNRFKKIKNFNFDKIVQEGLMPPDENYASWIKKN
jgi:hypothetical protein